MFACALFAAVVRAEEPMLARLSPDLAVFPQFFSVAQGTDRQLYVGGIDGILRNDGGRWIWEHSPKPGPVRALLVDARGRVWYGGSDSFGYLQTLPTGEQQYVDLAPQFSADLHGEQFSDVWRVVQYRGLFWFQALRDLFAVDAQGHRVGYWHRDQRFGFVGAVHGDLWVQWRGEGMRRWDGKQFTAVPGTQAFAAPYVYDLFSLPDGGLLAHQPGKGLFFWRAGATAAIADAAPGDDMAHIQTGVAIPGGRFAFAGDDGRLRIFDLAQRRFQSTPIGHSFISQVTLDRDGALLAVDNSGVVRLRWPPRWSRYGDSDGVAGDVHAIDAIDGDLYLCGSAGVQSTHLSSGVPMLPVQDRKWSVGECWQVVKENDALLVAGSLALAQITGDHEKLVSRDDLYPRALLVDPADRSRLWVGTEHGAALFHLDASGISEVGELGQIGWRAATLAPAPGGAWVGSDNHGLALARADAKAPQGFTLQPWGADRGVLAGPSGEVQVSALPDGVYASSQRGLFRYRDGRFVPDDAGGLAPLLAEGEVVRLLSAQDDDRWAFSYHTVFRKARGGRWRVVLVGDPNIGAIESLLDEPGNDALVGTSGQLLRFHVADGSAGEGKSGGVRVTAMRLERGGEPAQLLALDRPPQVMASGGGIDFDLGFTDFATGADKQYQVWMEGLSKSWSAWSPQASYRFFALPPGRYALHIRARGADGGPVDGVPFAFSIVPRWYERAMVIPLLIVGVCALVAAALIQRQRLRVRRLRLRNRELDRLVRERTLDLERFNLRLQDLADRDGLTCIANRRRFDAFLGECLPRATGRGQALGLAMVDVDHFKRFNDGHGHQAGDDILRKVACLLRDGVRGDTLVARYGGEEFALVAPGCDLAAMRELAERLRAQIAASDLGVTVSIGICALDPGLPESAHVLLARADAALYRAKEGGRNRVIA
ncbi:MAG: GGDEF domain-containing protein [Proteobacteria bacterium]|nr:GGDEF domain-containing protein [Pseudomonadota bacterium]